MAATILAAQSEALPFIGTEVEENLLTAGAREVKNIFHNVVVVHLDKRFGRPFCLFSTLFPDNVGFLQTLEAILVSFERCVGDGR